jgi:hypothetical protein
LRSVAASRTAVSATFCELNAPDTTHSSGFVFGMRRARQRLHDDGRLAVKSEMTENPPERVETIERKLDALSSSVDERFDKVDKRFDEVDKRFTEIDRRFDEVSAAFVEQREYTEFAFGRLRREMIERFERVDQNMATRDQVERLRLGTVEHFQRLEQRFQSLEDKLDRFIEAQPRRTRRSRRTTKKA